MRIALASYRSRPHSGGQGIYVRNLSRELVALGHSVEVFSGPPYPVLDPGVGLTRLPSLDLYREPDPFRRPALREFRSGTDVLEYLTMCTAGFPEPRTFGLRLEKELRGRAGEFDLLHDNQTLAPALLRIARRGLPTVTTIHHPITRDRRLELENATGWQRLSKRRWYGFVGMQARVARRTGQVITVSSRSAADITADFGVAPQRMTIVPVGVDTRRFRPDPASRVPGRVVAVASADVPLKGLSVLIAAMRRLDPDVWSELIVVGSPNERTRKSLADAGLLHKVTFRHGIPDDELAALLASASVHVVPSLYEGFSLPAVEAMASGVPVVASAVGALPELVAGGGGLLVPAADPAALAGALAQVLTHPDQAAAMGSCGRARASATYSWRAVAAATVQVYSRVLAGLAPAPADEQEHSG